jgi:hypothetical protein
MIFFLPLKYLSSISFYPMGNVSALYVSGEMENRGVDLAIDRYNGRPIRNSSAVQPQTSREFFLLQTRRNSYIQPLAIKYAKPAKI